MNRRAFLAASVRAALLASSAAAGAVVVRSRAGALPAGRAGPPSAAGSRGDGDVVYRKLRPVSDPGSNYPGLKPETVLLPKGSRFEAPRWHGGTRPLPVDVLFERDVAIPLRDGTTIYADVFRPPGAADVPAIVAWSPYGKEGGYWSHNPDAAHPVGPAPRPEWISGLQKFEGPDPAEWVPHGYAVANVDPRGAFMSEGDLHFFGAVEALDVYDTVEWIAAREWCSGRVGMQGNSWLAMSQWFAAAERPPHLAAIAPWNGLFDMYTHAAVTGGIPNPRFAEVVCDLEFGNNRIEHVPSMVVRYPLKNDYWETHEAELERIDIPVYATVSPLQLHRSTFEAFRRLPPGRKWIRTITTHEWYDQFTPEYVADLRRFFDRYLKDVDNGWESTPTVRLSVLDPGLDPGRSANGRYADSPYYVPAAVLDRPEDEWPLTRTRYTTLHLDPANGRLASDRAGAPSSAAYPGPSGQVAFRHTFADDTELTGYSVARLWVEVVGGRDADLFLRLDKLAPGGAFLGLFQASQLRVSHRALDAARSTAFMPYQAHRRRQLLAPGERVRVDIGFFPNSMLFRRGEQLRLTISGSPFVPDEAPTGEPFQYGLLLDPVGVNPGTHVIHAGGACDSHLVLPVTPPKPAGPP